MRFIICYFFSILIIFIVNKTLIYFMMRSFSLIFTFIFRFKTNNHDIKEARIFNYIDAEIDNYDVNI